MKFIEINGFLLPVNPSICSGGGGGGGNGGDRGDRSSSVSTGGGPGGDDGTGGHSTGGQNTGGGSDRDTTSKTTKTTKPSTTKTKEATSKVTKTDTTKTDKTKSTGSGTRSPRSSQTESRAGAGLNPNPGGSEQDAPEGTVKDTLAEQTAKREAERKQESRETVGQILGTIVGGALGIPLGGVLGKAIASGKHDGSVPQGEQTGGNSDGGTQHGGDFTHANTGEKVGSGTQVPSPLERPVNIPGLGEYVYIDINTGEPLNRQDGGEPMGDMMERIQQTPVDTTLWPEGAQGGTPQGNIQHPNVVQKLPPVQGPGDPRTGGTPQGNIQHPKVGGTPQGDGGGGSPLSKGPGVGPAPTQGSTTVEPRPTGPTDYEKVLGRTPLDIEKRWLDSGAEYDPTTGTWDFSTKTSPTNTGPTGGTGGTSTVSDISPTATSRVGDISPTTTSTSQIGDVLATIGDVTGGSVGDTTATGGHSVVNIDNSRHERALTPEELALIQAQTDQVNRAYDPRVTGLTFEDVIGKIRPTGPDGVGPGGVGPGGTGPGGTGPGNPGPGGVGPGGTGPGGNGTGDPNNPGGTGQPPLFPTPHLLPPPGQLPIGGMPQGTMQGAWVPPLEHYLYGGYQQYREQALGTPQTAPPLVPQRYQPIV